MPTWAVGADPVFDRLVALTHREPPPGALVAMTDSTRRDDGRMVVVVLTACPHAGQLNEYRAPKPGIPTDRQLHRLFDQAVQGHPRFGECDCWDGDGARATLYAPDLWLAALAVRHGLP